MHHTLLCMSIKVGTAKLYLKTSTKLFLKNNQYDPTIVRTGSIAPVLQSVYHASQRWEAMLNRQESATMDMANYLISQARKSSRDSFATAMADWIILGQQSNFRRSE